MDYEFKIKPKQPKSLPEIFSQKLNFWMNIREKRQVDLAKELGKSDQAIANWRKGKSMPSLDTIDKISALLNISSLDLLTDDAEVARSVKTPILGRIVAGDETSPLADKIGETEVPANWVNTGQYFALRVKGDSMAPKILDGDIVIVKLQNYAYTGDIAIVFIGNEEASIKQVIRNKDNMILYGYNTDAGQPHVYTNDEIATLPITVLGRVVQIRRNV